jgi:hypothetical protein
MVVAVGALYLLMLVTWAALLDALSTSGLALAGLIALLFAGFGNRRLRVVGLLIGCALAVSLIVSFPRALWPVQDRWDEIDARIRRGGSASLSWREKAAIASTNLVMAGTGLLLGWPEISRETFLMFFHGPAERTWNSDFAMGSAKVRAVVREWVESLPSGAPAGTQITLSAAVVSWPSYFPEMRIAMALNPLHLTGAAVRRNGRWDLHCTGRVRCDYPAGGMATMIPFRGRAFAFPENLFHALQDQGWMHPYTARWQWRVASDERLR